MQGLQNQGQKVCCYVPHQKLGTAAKFKSRGIYSIIKLFQIVCSFVSSNPVFLKLEISPCLFAYSGEVNFGCYEDYPQPNFRHLILFVPFFLLDMVIQGRNMFEIIYVFTVSLNEYWQDYPPDWDLLICFIMVGHVNRHFHKGLPFYSGSQLLWDLETFWGYHWCAVICFGFRHGINIYMRLVDCTFFLFQWCAPIGTL